MKTAIVWERIKGCVRLLGKYKPKIRPLWHDRVVGEDRCGQWVDDYEDIAYDGNNFYFHKSDGSAYVTDFEWEIILALYMSDARDEMLKIMGERK
jgi:hypothetical protein